MFAARSVLQLRARENFQVSVHRQTCRRRPRQCDWRKPVTSQPALTLDALASFMTGKQASQSESPSPKHVLESYILVHSSAVKGDLVIKIPLFRDCDLFV